jgi:hypothetical protein
LLLTLDVWIFVRTDCPVSNRYAPTIARLQKDFAGRARFQLVYPEPGVSREAVDAHRRAFGLLDIAAVVDGKLALVRKAGVRVTPEAVVFDGQGRLLYRGRIDDRQASLTVSRSPRMNDLREAIDGVLSGTLRELRSTRAIGCAIEGLPSASGRLDMNPALQLFPAPASGAVVPIQ